MRWLSAGPPVHFPDRRRKAMMMVLAICCLSGTLTLTSCNGLSAQAPTGHVSHAISQPMHFLDKDRSLHPHLRLEAEFPNAMVRTFYRTQISISRGTAPYRFSIIGGRLPAGLLLDGSTGAISGTPLTAGTYQFAIRATDSSDAAGARLLSINVQPATPASDIGIAVSPATESVASGSKVQFTSTITGTSNVAVDWTATVGAISSAGLFAAPAVSTNTTVTITAASVADPSKKASATVMIMATPVANTPPVIVSTNLPTATPGVPYSAVLTVAGGKSPYVWSSSSGSLPRGLTLNSSGTISGTPQESGTFSLLLKVTDATSLSATRDLILPVSNLSSGGGAATGFDGPAELPRVYMQSDLADTPAPGRTTPVNAGADLQAALNSAGCGDIIELQAGATFSGRYVLPAKACDDQHWITIRTSAPDTSLPAEGVRLTPCYAGVAALPGRPALNCSSGPNVLAKIVYPGSGSGPLLLASGANHYRLLGLEITRAVGSGSVGELVQIQPSAAVNHVVVDRVWLHGTGQDETARGIDLTGATYFAVVDSYFSDFHCIAKTGACTDAQAIAGGLGTVPSGVFKIVDNFLEASGENVMFGGGAASVTPADIEIRRNHLFKPLAWMRATSGFIGGVSGNAFIVKNHFELKNAQRVLFEGNVLENSWGGFSQSGFSVLLTPKNQAGRNGTNICPVCQVTDVTIRYNTISHVGAGFQIATARSDNGGMALAGARFSIHDVTLDDINAQHYLGAGVLVMLLNGWSRNVLSDVSLDHITGFPDPHHQIMALLDVAPNPAMSGFKFTNSILGAAAYPVWSAGGGPGNCAYSDVPVTSLSTCFDSYTFLNNAVIGVTGNYPASKWPAGNYFLASAQDAQFVNYNNAIGGDYQLVPSSRWKNAASDGKDLGADIHAIQEAIQGVY
jgi:Putative Ig domain